MAKLGINTYKAWKYANTRKSYWRISDTPFLHQVLNNKIQEKLEFTNIKEIRQENEYGGYRVSLNAKFDKLDITTGDVIVAKEVNYKFELMF